MIFDCPACALFVGGAGTMQQYMWHVNITGGEAQILMDGLDMLDAPI